MLHFSFGGDNQDIIYNMCLGLFGFKLAWLEFSWIWAPKLEAKSAPLKNNSSPFCRFLPQKTEFSKFSGFYWIFLQFSPKFPDFSQIFQHFFLKFWPQFCTQVAYTSATSALRTLRIKRAGGGSGSASSIN